MACTWNILGGDGVTPDDVEAASTADDILVGPKSGNYHFLESFDPDFIAIAGDIVESGNEQRDWDEFWKHNAGQYNNIAGSVPIFPAVGNHENHSGGDGGGGFYTTPLAKDAVARYRAYFETPDNGSGKPEHQDRYYRVDYGPITFITIDSSNGSPHQSKQDTNWYLLGEGEASDDNPEWGEGEAPDFNPGSIPVAGGTTCRRAEKKPIHFCSVSPQSLLGRPPWF